MSSLSVIEPISRALQRTQRILFEPFQLAKWLRLGLCAFLTGSLPLGGLGGSQQSTPFKPDNEPTNGDVVMPWLRDHLAMVLIAAGIAALILLLIGVLFTWLSSRARFMLLDGVVRNRGAIAEPWHNYRREGNSLFRFRFLLGLISMAALVLILAVMLLISLKDWQTQVFSLRTVSALLLGGVCILGLLVVVETISMLLMDFVVPVMYLRRLPIRPAAKLVINSLAHEHRRALFLYLMMRFLLNICLSALTFVAIMLSFSIVLIPYIGSVLLLPLSVFQLTYPLAFLEQLGPEWSFLPSDRPPLQPS